MSFGVVFVVVVVLAALQASSAVDYCNLASCKGRQNIACNNNGAYASICAKDAKVQAIPATLRTAILNKHNELRNQIAGGSIQGFKPATRMATMQWNTELAKLAALNVKQCKMQHDSCRNTPAFRFAGQNLAYTGWSGSKKTLQAVAMQQIQSWFNEYKDSSMTQINKYSSPSNNKVTGHFTQLVQELATRVGCAILTQTKNGLKEQYMACNYSHTNILNAKVYTSGKAAAECKTGVNPKYKFLCSVKEVYDDNAV